MQLRDGKVLVSASDLVGFLECEHFSALSLQDLVSPLKRAEDDESAVLIQDKGFKHEAAYLERLRAQGMRVVEMPDQGDPTVLAKQTEAAMVEGPDVIFQAAFLSGPLFGRADFLRRVERPSRFGPFGYEVHDTKLARSPKAKFVVQLSFYSDLLENVQQAAPHSMHLVLGDGTQRSFRVANYSRYFRQVKDQFLAFVGDKTASAGTYPERCAHCPYCPWRDICGERWLKDDHLNQVAGITRNQIERLRAGGTTTMAALATLPTTRIARLQADTVSKIRSQAALQVAFRESGERKVEVLGLDPAGRRGFFRLPTPDEGDVFFDMEGDPLDENGLEYLFGVRYSESGQERFQPYWAHDRTEEAKAFEQFIDFVTERRKRFPQMHIYHYGSYEPSALKRLMSLHGVREAQVDALLRAGAFVDLYKVVREAIRTSQPGYSIKDIEAFYMPPRQGEVQDAGASIVHYERWKETKDNAELAKIQSYNEDDCRSTELLRNWLLTRRPEGLPWYTGERTGADELKQEISEKTRQIEEALAKFRQALIGSHPADRTEWTPEHHFRELVFQLLDFHRRSDKPQWWAMFARQDMTHDELMDDVECLVGLTQEPGAVPEPVKRSLVYTFTYPEQETKLRAGKRCRRTDTAESFGEIVELDEEARRIKIKVSSNRQVPAMLSIGPEGPVNNDVLRDAVWRFASSVVAGDGRFAAVRALLTKEAPKLKGRSAGTPITKAAQPAEALDAVLRLDRSYIFIQGPPGAGKTTTGSELIVGLLKEGKRVGVTSNSHKAVNNLLQAIESEAVSRGVTFAGAKKSNKTDPESHFNGKFIKDCFDNSEVFDARYRLMAGTAWLFADPDLEDKLDYLFVDEAGQVSLAYLVAMGTSAKNIILLGDQMQLAQPVQGVHPGRSGESSLEYLLDAQAAVPEDRGIFLGTTWRMHDDVCRFISEAVYDGRLKSDPENKKQHLVLAANAHPALAPTGIRFVRVVHEGCAQRSEPEGDVVKALVESLLNQRYVTKNGEEKPVTLADILIVAPYNAQVNYLKSILPSGARVGTIDKFQGQQAEVVIASMTTSSGDDLTRNIEFLFSKNRLNVAVSRAKCLAIVVASPDLLKVRCTSVGQIELVNTLCWLQQYAEGR